MGIRAAPPGDSECTSAIPVAVLRGVGLVVFTGGRIMYVESCRRLVACGRSVVVAAAADSVPHPSRGHQYYADDEQDDPDGHQGQVGVEDESGDDEDDSEDDHDDYLVSVRMLWRRVARVND